MEPMNSPTTAPTSAKPKLVWRLAMIHVRAEGSTTCVVTSRRLAPRMRAFAITSSFTSRTPWKALKKTTKKTRTKARATLDGSPSPSQMMKIEPSTTRGIEFAALMYGPSTSARRRIRPSATPKMTPPTTPKPKPSSASSTVIRMSSQSGPSGEPTVAQCQIFCAISDGRPKKNGSIVLVRDSSSQLPSSATPKAIRNAITSWRRWRSFRFAAATPASSVTLDMLLPPLVADENLVAEVVPDLPVELDEARLEADLGDLAGTRQVDLVDAFHRPGPGGDHADAIGERDRLLEVVRDEDDGRRHRRPEVEQLVLHQRPRLHVERAERLVHQDDLG